MILTYHDFKRALDTVLEDIPLHLHSEFLSRYVEDQGIDIKQIMEDKCNNCDRISPDTCYDCLEKKEAYQNGINEGREENEDKVKNIEFDCNKKIMLQNEKMHEDNAEMKEMRIRVDKSKRPHRQILKQVIRDYGIKHTLTLNKRK